MIIRDIPPEDYRKLQARAAKYGVSIEDYVLRLITDAVRGKRQRSAGEVLAEIRRRYPGVGFEEGEIKELRSPIKPVDFS